MRYLQIPDHVVDNGNNLRDLIWPEDATPEYEYDYIYHKNVFLVSEHHPNIAFIAMRLDQISWTDYDPRPVKFMTHVL